MPKRGSFPKNSIPMRMLPHSNWRNSPTEFSNAALILQIPMENLAQSNFYGVVNNNTNIFLPHRGQSVTIPTKNNSQMLEKGKKKRVRPGQVAYIPPVVSGRRRTPNRKTPFLSNPLINPKIFGRPNGRLTLTDNKLAANRSARFFDSLRVSK